MRRPRAPGLGSSVNWQLVVPVVGGTLGAVGVGMAVCALTAVVAGDGAGDAFATPAAGAIVVGALALASARRLRSIPFRPRDGFLAVTLAWLAAAIAGAVPFMLHGTLERPVDAFFESMSGFTTTGATLLGRIEEEPHAILLWRSLSQWMGGVGIVVLVVAIAPATGMATNRVFYAETSGMAAERLTPRIADTAKILWGIYVALTAAGFVAYSAAGMGPFDAANHILTTIATGGFSTRTASIGAFDSLAIELVAIVFMVLGGVNFALYWRALRGADSLRPQLPELRAYLVILVVATAVVTLSLIASDTAIGAAEALRDSAFTVVSITTSTGYITADFDEWNSFGQLVMLMVMFIGGCAGSTAGGMKVIRIVLLGKAAAQEIERQLRPTTVQVLRMGGRVFSEEVRKGVLAFFSIYMLVFAVGTVVMTLIGVDGTTAVSSVIASLNIIGPGLGEVGATENYAAIPSGGLWFLSALMLAGRLEVFTVLVLLTPAFWRRSVA
ncbi:MAG TPA: potassium transporter TrkG [Solirubrobacteraceae bacterium]|nr:potassium transporter TrkG [Solirubrobacteraceae bacterium]